ncbi:ABC transporter ATP-binding protein [Dongia sp.]|uniref:ABC transporter ATP-binding protein n=1 Tax=Dongia sp. TaxID=1977262 RepID=UPI0035AF8C91
MSIAARDIRWSAGGRLIVDGVSLEVPAGKTVGLIGPNGSGKSSLLRLLCKLRRVEGGVITLGGTDIASLTARQIGQRTAFVEQQVLTEADLTVADVVRLGRTPHRSALAPWTPIDESAVAEALSAVGLTEFSTRLWRTLSGGEKQRVQIARALAQSPSELLLDEPTNHLDIQHQLEILSLVSSLPLTVIVALHDLNLAAMFCDTLVVLNQGRVCAHGTPVSVLTKSLLREVFGVSADIQLMPGSSGIRLHFLPDRIVAQRSSEAA